MDEYLKDLQEKYGYSEELIEALGKIIPAFIEHFGKENEKVILDAIASCEIHIQGEKEKSEEYISEYFPNKVVERIPTIAVAFYDSMPVVENNKISSKRLLYLTSKVKGGMQDERTISLLVHEMGHLVKSYKDEYTIVDGKIHKRSGIIKSELHKDEKTGKFIEENQINTGIEEAINCFDEEHIMSIILGRPFITKSYFGKLHQTTEKLMQNKEIMEAYRNAQINGTDEYEKIMGKEQTEEVSDLYENLHLTITKPILAQRMNDGTDIKTLVKNAENEILKFIDKYEKNKKENFSIENIEKLDKIVSFDERETGIKDLKENIKEKQEEIIKMEEKDYDSRI